MQEPLIQNVSDTAFLVAGYRSIESKRSDALFRDPLAEKLIGDHGQAILKSIGQRAKFGIWSIVIRTVIIDEFINLAIKDGVDTIINLGAGLDTRPYRMSLPANLRWIEVDIPHMIDWKTNLLLSEKPICKLERIGLDLNNKSAREKMLKDISSNSERVLILTEGVILYLSENQVAELAQSLRSIKNCYGWIVDYFSREMLERRERFGEAKHLKNAPFLFKPENWSDFFNKLGWVQKEMKYLPEVALRLGRPFPLPLPFRILVKLRRLFMSEKRKNEFQRFAGYAILAPRLD